MVEINSKMLFLYILIFKTVLSKALLKLLVLINYILKDQNLYTGPHMYAIKKNLLARDALWIFEHKLQSSVN